MLTLCEWPGWRSIERGVKIGLWAVAHQWTHLHELGNNWRRLESAHLCAPTPRRLLGAMGSMGR